MQENKSNRTHQRKGGNPDFIIEELLPYGRENSISTKELMTVLNLFERELRARVRRAADEGGIRH